MSRRRYLTVVLDQDGKDHCVYVGPDFDAAVAAMDSHTVPKAASIEVGGWRRPRRSRDVVKAWVTDSVDLSKPPATEVAPVESAPDAEPVDLKPAALKKSKALK